MKSLLNPLAFAVAMALAAPLAHAQSAPATPAATEEDEAVTLDAVTVTGSNLRGIDLQEAQPITILDADDIKKFGATSVADLLKQVSETGGGTGNFSTANSGALQADAPAGTAGASLRGLGTSSTLTLVNGRRVAASSFANGSENFVDINAIPMAAIDRIEILTTGASAIYGADAVAGVINLILRKDFEGLRLSASYGDSTRSTDEGRFNANLVAGFARDNVRGMLILDAFQRNALYDRDRAISAVEPRPSQQGIFPSFNDLNFRRNDIVEARCPRDQFGIGRFGEYCAVNRNAFTATDPQLETLGAYGTLSVDFGDGMEYFAELALQRNESRADSSPAPWTEERIAFNHPGMPAELRQRFISQGFDTTALVGIGRFPDARTLEVTTRNWRILNGLRGSAGAWDWETTLSAAESESRQEAVAGIYNVSRIRAGLLGRLCASGATNCSPGAGGLWYDPFNGQAGNSQQVLDLVREQVPRDGTSTLYAWDGKLTGTMGSLGGGDVAWAFGAELRREEITDEPSPLATIDRVTGRVPVYGFGSTAVEAARTQWALFAETNLPLTDTFDVRLAARYDHYDDFGGDVNPSIGLRWRASDSVLLRGGWNTSFRAPSLAQVGAGTSLSSGALPCSVGSEFYTSFCGRFAGDDGYLSEIYGNPDLDAETSTAWYLGSVFNLGDRTTLTLDYWNFDQRDLVDIDPLELFRQALVDPSLVYNSRPRPSNANQRVLLPGVIGIATRGGRIGDPVDQVQLQLINIGQQRTDGIDLSLEHAFQEGGWGQFDAYVDATWTHSFERSESCSPIDVSTRRGAGPCSNGVRLFERVGEFRYPEWLVNTGVSWARGDWSARLWVNYVDGYYDDDELSNVPAGRRVASWTTLGASVNWDIDDRQSLGLNIRNLGDRDPPRALGSANNFDDYNHNSLGRFLTFNYIYRH